MVNSYEFRNEWDLEQFDVTAIQEAYDQICHDIDNNSEPLDEIEMVKLFSRAWVKTVGKAEDQISLDVALDIYCDDLRAFPAAHVRKVLQEWPSKNKWRPSWYTLVEEIRRLDSRHKLKQAFRTMLNKLGIPFSELN